MNKDTQKAIQSYDLTPSDRLKEIDSMDLGKLSFDECVQLGMDVTELRGYSGWIIGKLADRIANPPMEKLSEEGVETDGEIKVDLGALKRFASSIGVAYATVRTYASTYRKYISADPNFHPLNYHGSVNWTIMNLIGAKVENPVEVLNELHDKGKTGSVEQAAVALKELQEQKNSGTNSDIPAKPKIVLEYEPEKKLFKLVIEPEDFPKIDFMAVKSDLMEYLEALV